MTDLELQKFVTLYRDGDDDPMYVVTNEYGIEYHQLYVDEGTNGIESGLFYVGNGWEHSVDHSHVFFTYADAKQYTTNNVMKTTDWCLVGDIEGDFFGNLLRTDIKITSDLHMFSLLKRNFIISPSDGVYWSKDSYDNIWVYYVGEGGWRRCAGLVLDSKKQHQFTTFAVKKREI